MLGGVHREFPYVFRYKQGKENVVVNALSRRYVLLSTLDAKLLCFEQIKELYKTDHYFCEEYKLCKKSANGRYFRHDVVRTNYACLIAL
jgi:hypothetical protein